MKKTSIKHPVGIVKIALFWTVTPICYLKNWPAKLAIAKSSEFRLSEENFRFAQASVGAKKFKELPNHL